MKKIYYLLFCMTIGFNTLGSDDCQCVVSATNLTITNGTTTIVNAYYPGSANALTGSRSITVGAEQAAGANGTIAIGDLVLVIQMQGAEINTTLPDQTAGDYGDGAGGNDRAGYLDNEGFIAGHFEYVIATSAVVAGGGTLTFDTDLQNNYINQTTEGNFTTTQGKQAFQVVKVGNYSILEIQPTGNLTGLPWNGSSGGIVAIDVLTSFIMDGTIDASYLGFRGGLRELGNVNDNDGDTDDATSTTAFQTGIRGEGIAGSPTQVYGYNDAPLNSGVLTALRGLTNGYPGVESLVVNVQGTNPNQMVYNGYRGAGAPGNAGGAGRFDGSGGGGSNGSFGGNGGYPTGGGGIENAGIGGVGLSVESGSRAFLGGGGGSGGFDNDLGFTTDISSGHPGGGIVLIRANNISGAGAGTINADGSGSAASQTGEGAGGGGAGGSILLVTDTEDISFVGFNAVGGNGGTTNTADDGGGGGGAGGQVLLVRRGGNFSGAPTATVTGGAVGGSGAGAVVGDAGDGSLEVLTVPPAATFDCPLINVAAAKPGGISDDLIIWFKSDEDVSYSGTNQVTSWVDHSALSLEANDFYVANNSPDYIAEDPLFNFNPSISFNEGADLDEYLGFYLAGEADADHVSGIIVLNNSDITNTQTPVSFYATVADVNEFDIDLTVTNGFARQTNIGNATDGTSDVRDGDTHIIVSDYSVTGTQGRIWVDNVLETTDAALPVANITFSTGANFVLGQKVHDETDGGFVTTEAFQGRIAEVIVYDTDLLQTNEMNQIHSYLAIKYGLTIDVTKDYVNSIGESIYPSSTNGLYVNDIAGVGQDYGSGLDQKKSKSINSDAVVTMEVSSFATDRQFVIWGNDNGTFGFAASELPTSITTRMTREWKVAVSNGLEDASLTLDLTGAASLPAASENLMLIIDDDGDFSTGVKSTVSASSWDGTTATFNNVDFADGDFFSVGVTGGGPGGVSTSLVTWLRADVGTSTTTDNTALDTWTDQSAAVNNASGGATQPTFKDNVTDNMNGNPVIDFDGTDDRMTIALDALEGSNYSLFAVGERVDARGNNYLLGSDGSTNDEVLHFGYRLDGTATVAQWANDLDVTVNAFDAPAVSPFILFGELSGAGHKIEQQRDGIISSATNANTTSIATNANQLYLGYFGDTPSYFGGQMAEVIAISSELTNEEEQRVYSYLALKYGVSLDATTDYLASDGSVIFPSTSSLPDYTTYTNDIAGIGRDDLSSLSQISSRSEDADDVLTMSIASFTNNLSFVMWGNDDVATTEITSDLPENIVTRLGREWRVSNVGSISGLTVTFDLSGIAETGTVASDFTLMIDANGDFTDGFVETVQATSFAGDVVTFENVSITDDYIITLGTSKTAVGPAGITDNIALWLKADAGTNCFTEGCAITTWEDQSGNNNDFVAGTAPELNLDSLNGNSVISFDETNNEYLTLASTNLNPRTVFIVYLDQSTAGRATPFTNNDTDDGNGIGYGFTDDTQIFDATASTGTPVDVLTGANSVNAIDIGNGTAHERPDTYEIHTRVLASNLSNATFDYYLGNDRNTGSTTISGGIAEVIVYSDVLSADEITVVESYLAIKYGQTMNNGDYDLEGADGTVVYPGNSDATYADYQNDIAGIGRSDIGGFEQLSSKSGSSTAILQVAKNESFLADQQSIIWGRNGLDYTSINESDIPSGTESRIDRLWRFSIVNSPTGTLDLSFDLGTSGLTPADLRLIVDGDGVFANSTVLNPTVSLLGNVYTFEDVDISNFSDGDYFTIAAVDASLPLTWLSFDAVIEDNGMLLSWTTTNEINVSHFIVEKSLDGLNYFPLDKMTANNIQSSVNEYNYLDADLSTKGIRYYKVLQVDFDGKHEYSDVVSVNGDALYATDITAYPNPFQDVFAIESAVDLTGAIQVIDISGQIVLSQTLDQTKKIELD
ncbi:MAG: T9SS type A sorting domain-containing protein, partial [Reichenbachiella sp.]